ncbi:MAG: tRNA pseudouridine(38-40) synthase TruA [Fimbriimonadaceae bacterium]
MSTKKRIKLVVQYDGYDFCGWAPQAGQRTVHGTLTEGIRLISSEEIEVTGASRTDSGAHAKGQVCHFDAEQAIPPERWAYALNRALPPDMKIVSSQEVPADFHSRFWAKKRFYRYRILNGEIDPFRSRYTFRERKQLDLESMQIAAQDFVGTHNFLAFSQEIKPGQNLERTLYSVDVKASRDEIWVDVVGTAFVRGMMRRISGCLWEIGRGLRPTSDVQRLLQMTDRRKIDWPTVLPACGLTLMKITYGRHPFDNRFTNE